MLSCGKFGGESLGRAKMSPHRRRSDSATAHYFDEVGAAFQSVPRRLQHLRHSIARASERVRMSTTAACSGVPRPEIGMSTCIATYVRA